MTKPSSMTRVCTACGLEKPLSAFLYLSSQSGTTYGTICATCRGKGIKEKAQKFVPEDERSSTTSVMRIGAKQLLEIELQKKREKEERKNRQEEEAKKRDQVISEKDASKELKEKAEKFHREVLDEKKKQAFLTYESKKQLFSAQSILGQKKPDVVSSPLLDEKQRAVETAKLNEAIKQEERKTKVDLSSGGPVLEEQSFHITRDATLKRLQSLLGGDAPILKTMSQFYKTSAGKQEKPKKDMPKDPQEFIEKTWGPSSRKR